MRTLASAAATLASLDTLDDLARLASALGFHAPALPLDADARAGLGLPDAILDAHVAPGPGSCRCLLALAAPGTLARTLIAQVAARLASRTPHVLWLLLATERDGHRTAIAAWTSSARPRVALLLADRRRILASDAETVRALATTLSGHDADDAVAHARWLEVLGRDSLTRRFYRTLEQRVARLARDAAGPGTPAERSELALLASSRLLFLAFLEAKGWLDGDHAWLTHRFDDAMTRGGHFHQRVLAPLFFGTLNTPPRRRAPAARALGALPFLNGGLFAPTPLERRLRPLRFDDASLGAFLGDLLGRYRFTAHEETAAISEVAVDPEMLGRAFESLMQAGERRETGAFYTPQRIVERVTDEALLLALSARHAPREVVARALAGETPDDDQTAAIRRAIGDVAILDPACGSGAFLVHALERLASLARRAGDERPVEHVRRDLLTRTIFGVDRNPTAVWLCELRLWLSVVVESEELDPARVTPLPNLDRNIRVGDALAGGTFARDGAHVPGGATLRRLRARYARATGTRKADLARSLDREERRHALAATARALATAVAERREAVLALRARDLFGQRASPTPADRDDLAAHRTRVATLRRERRRLLDGGALAFRFDVQFADVAQRAGFDAVIGNPPWVRLHRIPASDRASLREQFAVFRHAGWEPGASRAGAAPGFATQVDTAALFTERALDLLRPGGALSLLLPSKLWRTLAGGGARRLLSRSAHLRVLEDWSDAPTAFDASVYPSLLVATKRAGDAEPSRDDVDHPCVRLAVRRRGASFTWGAPRAAIPLDGTPGSPWLVLPTPVRAAIDRLSRLGTPLADGPLGRPILGVKSGCNDAFVVSARGATETVARVVARDGREGCIESALLRPLLAGHALAPWHAPRGAAYLVWPHDEHLEPLASLPPHAARWLMPWRRDLERRSDARGRRAWWSLFRTDAAATDRARVVWGDVGRAPRAVVLEPGDPTVPLNSCYVVRCDPDDAHALAALLNAPLASAWLAALAEPARGGYHRYLAWTMALLPMPRDWTRARDILAPLGRRAADGDAAGATELLEASLACYRARRADVEPLVTWFEP